MIHMHTFDQYRNIAHNDTDNIKAVLQGPQTIALTSQWQPTGFYQVSGTCDVAGSYTLTAYVNDIIVKKNMTIFVDAGMHALVSGLTTQRNCLVLIALYKICLLLSQLVLSIV